MQATDNEKMIYGSNVNVLKRTKDFNVYEVKNGTGRGIMTSYQVLDGIQVIYNDIRMQTVSIDLGLPKEGYFEINHCREGRIECEFNNEYLYMSKDDFSINRKDSSCDKSYFPVSHYYGISIFFDIDKAQKEIERYLSSSKIKLEKLFEKLCNKSGFMIMKANESIGHIFAELYSIPEKIKMEYFKLKVLEVILFLSALEEDKKEKRSYYTRKQVNKIKAIEKHITKDFQKRYTLKELSIEYDIALTTMKKCFKGVYGKSIYSYIREQRMKKAADMLISTDDTILRIANMVGYENGSKFASAFKAVIGLSPKEFREHKEMMSDWS